MKQRAMREYVRLWRRLPAVWRQCIIASAITAVVTALLWGLVGLL